MRDFVKGTVTPRDWINVAVALGIAIVLAVLGFYFGINPMKADIIAKNQELDSLKIQLREARDLEKDIERLREEEKKWGEVVELFQERLPEKREIPRLLRQFEQLGSDIGLSVELSQESSTRDASKETIPYSVVARGDFHQIVTFINLLEREQRYLKISDLNIGPQENGQSEASFTLSTFQFLQSTSTQTEEDK